MYNIPLFKSVRYMGTIASDYEMKVFYNMKLAQEVICGSMLWSSVQEAQQLDNHLAQQRDTITLRAELSI